MDLNKRYTILWSVSTQTALKRRIISTTGRAPVRHTMEIVIFLFYNVHDIIEIKKGLIYIKKKFWTHSKNIVAAHFKEKFHT